MTCPKCKGDNPASASACQYCGASLGSATAPSGGGATQDPEIARLMDLEAEFSRLPTERTGGTFGAFGDLAVGKKESPRVAFWKNAYVPSGPKARMTALEMSLSRAKTLSATIADKGLMEMYSSLTTTMSGGDPDVAMLNAIAARMRTLLDLVRLDAAREDGSVSLRQVETYEAFVASVEKTLSENKAKRTRGWLIIGGASAAPVILLIIFGLLSS